MTIDPVTSGVIAKLALAQPIKDLYIAGKAKFHDALVKWNNSKNIALLTTKVRSFERVRTIWQRDKEIPLSSFYYPSKIAFPSGITKKVDSLKELPVAGNLVIEGTVGQGKSIFLRYLCIQELKRNASGRIPIFIELRKLSSNNSLLNGVKDSLTNLGFSFSDELFEFYAESGKMVLLLDAFDELEENCVAPVISTLENWSQRFPKLQIIVTSRPNAEVHNCSFFTVLKLSPLSSDDHKPFLMKVGVTSPHLDHLLSAISHSRAEIKEFLTTPLLLTLLILVYKAENAIPSELPEFFEVLFVTVFSKHDGTKPGYRRPHKTDLNERKLELLFEGFCFAVLRNGIGVSLDANQLDMTLNEAKKFIGEKCDIIAFRHDLTKVASLLLEDGFRYVFAHRSLLDYFSAAFVKHRTELQATRIYGSLRTARSHLWRPVLNYLSMIDKYRYCRFYAIPELEAAFDFIRNDQIGSDIIDPRYIFQQIMVDTEVQIQHLSGGEWRITSINSFRCPNEFIESIFMDGIVGGLFSMQLDSREIERLSSAEDVVITQDGQNNSDRITLKIYSHDELINRSFIDKQIVSSVEKLKERRSEYSEFVNIQDKLADDLGFVDPTFFFHQPQS